MLEEIKKIQGINHHDFDDMINNWIQAGMIDLKCIGIVDSKINATDPLIKTALITYTLSFLDVPNSEMYASSYSMQKDVLRHLTEYNTEVV